MTPQAFREDITRSRLLLEELSGTPVLGYRAPGFSSTAHIPWFFNEVAASGYLYDSSVFPAHRGHGGNPNSELGPHMLEDEMLIELPARGPILAADSPATRRGRRKRVLVAGGGIGGLCCAYELMERGHDVTVLEASGRTGGHVRTMHDPLPDGLYADVGAEHFTKPGYEQYW